jgi:hypothetical protein
MASANGCQAQQVRCWLARATVLLPLPGSGTFRHRHQQIAQGVENQTVTMTVHALRSGDGSQKR